MMGRTHLAIGILVAGAGGLAVSSGRIASTRNGNTRRFTTS